MKHRILSRVAIAAVLVLASACMGDDDTQYPVSLITIDGVEFQVGTYDDVDGELSLFPAFVEDVDDGRGVLSVALTADEERHPFAADVSWVSDLGVGSTIDMTVGASETPAGLLIIHDLDWDGGPDGDAYGGSPWPDPLDEPWGCPPCPT